MSLRVWLPLNRDLRNNGLENVTVTNNGATFSDGCANFTTSQYMEISGLDFSKLNHASFCFWIKLPSNKTSWLPFTGQDTSHWLLATDPTVTEQNFYFSNVTGTKTIYEDGAVVTKPSFDGKWHHYCVTDAGISNWTQFLINKYGSGLGFNWNGQFYDLRIYDHALSKKEVAELVRGCVLHYPMNDTLNESTENLVGYNNLFQYNSTYQTLTETYYGQPVIRCTGTSSTNSGFAFGKSIDVLPNKSLTYSIYIRYNSVKIAFSSYHTGRINGTYTDPIISKMMYVKSTYQNARATEKTTIYDETRTNIVNWDDIEIGKWYFVETVLTNNILSDTTLTFVNYYFLNGTNAGTWDITCPQIELNDHATLYTSTGRNQNLNTANWASYTPYWTIESQTLNEIKLKQVNGQTVALVNHDIWPYLSLDTPVTVSGYLYKGDSPYQTSTSVLSNFSNICTVISRESRADGYFRFTVKYTTLSDSAMIIHSYGLFGYDNQPGDICYIRNMEWHITSYLKDVSGFDNHSLITGSLPLVTTPKSPRYDKCMNIDNSGTNKNYANCTIAAPQVKSASFWWYCPNTFPSGSQMIFQDKPTHMAFGFYSNQYCIIHANPASSEWIPSRYTLLNIVKYNSWNHIVINHLGTTTEMWLNGNKLSDPVTEGWGYNYEGFCLGTRVNQSGTSGNFTGKLSDFRLFSRVLTQADVDDLYKDSLSIDKSQNGYCYELNESDAQSSVDVKKNGQLKCKNYYEACPDTYDSNIYTEPDGSLWLRIFHHNNPANALFSSSDTFTTGVYKDVDRWFKVSLCNNVSKWELMVKQKAESNSTEQKYRWIQNANPMTAAYTDVTNDKVTPITTSGYLAFSSNFGGISLYSASVCYLRQNSNTNAGWWGAFGRVSTYNGGIENFTGSGGSQIIKSGYLDLYLRIDNLSTAELATLFTDEGNQIARIGKNSNVSTNEIHEY